ncbi:hypothetical protein BKA57DRAFT_444175 [Linnemannia elongata]|nr:hypothetical protein BKA57DRAFT_444175 [Linnemannia elongata]
MDVDMHMDTEPETTAAAQSGTSSFKHPPQLSPPATTTLTSLPTELILQVLSSLPLPILLSFRLVSSWTNTLVLEPVFWHRLEFSKQLLFKVGGGVGSSAKQLQLRRTSFGLSGGGGGGGAALPGGTGAGAGSRESVFQHNSDANLIVHRQSLAATLLSSTSSWVEDTRAVAGLDPGGAGPSVAISANIPRSIQQQQQQQHKWDNLSTSPTATQQLPKHSPWTKIEASFLSFLIRLALNPRTAHGVRAILLEDWEGVESVQVLWTTLSAFSKVQTLVVRNSALRHLRLYPSNDYTIDKDDGATTTWPELQELDFQDCVQLKDLEGIQAWLPHLQDFSLAGCTALDDFSPLTLTRPLLSSSPTPSTVQVLALKKASFIHTRIQDEELIALLRRSPELEELRLDQCYGLTVKALKAIAFGDQSPVSFGDGVEGQGAGAGDIVGIAGQAPMATMMVQEAQVAPPYHIPTATATANNDDNNNTGSPHTLAGPSQSLEPILTSATTSSSSSFSSSSASTSTTLPLPHPQPPNQQTGSYVPHLRKLSLKNCYDFTDEGIRSLVGCRHLEWLVIRGIRQVNEDTAEWLHSQGVPLRKLLSPLGRWRHWHV